MSIYNYHRYCKEQALKDKALAKNQHQNDNHDKVINRKHAMVENYKDRVNDFVSRMVERPMYINNDRVVNEKLDQNYRFRKNVSVTKEAQDHMKDAKKTTARFG